MIQSQPAASQAFSEFRPLRFFRNAHIQTLVGNLFPGRLPQLRSVERHVVLDDGDRLALQDSTPFDWREGGRIGLLVHGLGGTHASGYMLRTAAMLLEQGMRVVRMDLRGCGRGMELSRRTYNGGCSDDVRAVLHELHRGSPASPLTLIGFSLGGNIVLKLAGEAAERRVPGLECVAAVNPPIDLERCAALIGLARNRMYELYFLRSLTRQMMERQRRLPHLPRVRFPRYLTMRKFDDLYTARDGGFADATDYYRKSASLPLIPLIPVPALLLTARDDPFIDVDSFESLSVPEHIEVHIAGAGGHLGFLTWGGNRFIRWAEHRVVDWVTRRERVGAVDCP